MAGTFGADRLAHSMDNPLVTAHDGPMPLQEGFRGKRLASVPRPIVAEALRRPITGRLLVTDAGYYPYNASG